MSVYISETIFSENKKKEKIKNKNDVNLVLELRRSFSFFHISYSGVRPARYRKRSGFKISSPCIALNQNSPALANQAPAKALINFRVRYLETIKKANTIETIEIKGLSH